MTAKKNVREVIAKHYNEVLEFRTRQLKEFAEKLVKAPAHEMSWADNTFMHAAHISVAQQVLSMLDPKDLYFSGLDDAKLLKTAIEYMHEGVINKAQYAYNKSTSVSGSYMQECMMAAQTEAYSWLKRLAD